MPAFVLMLVAVAQPAPPRPLPPAVTAVQPAAVAPDVPLPHPEKLTKLDSGSVLVRRYVDGWQVWVGATLFRDFGPDQQAAEETGRALRELKPTAWAAIGSPRPVVEYGLTDGKPNPWPAAPKWACRST